ncbi:MAG: Na/Pi symporter [Candidatus Aenigmarchaeota archaeon]|nr:Na/Pi symporter [Candidatus Aenigmarchaeota archaeon]
MKISSDKIRSIFLLIIILYIFLLSIKLMSGSFKLFGNGFAEELFTITTNPFVGLFMGILATSLVQSSSVTTSIIVGMVAGGIIPIASAIPMVMGANIGTSVTNTFVSLCHIGRKEEFGKAFAAATIHDFFNLMAVIFLFPLEMYFHFLENGALFLTSFFIGAHSFYFTSPLSYILTPVSHAIIRALNNPAIILIASVFLLFVSLRYFIKIASSFAKTEFDLFSNYFFKTPARGFSFGLLMTAFVQSSSVTTSLIVPFAGIGILTLEKIFPYVLGANIGTTITGILAALATGSSAGITIALVHLLFNIAGILMIYPIKNIPLGLARRFSDLSLKSRSVPVFYVVSAFFLVPLVVILTV